MDFEWMFTIFPLFLTGLKIIGVIGAFYGFTEGGDPTGHRRKLPLPPTAFLAVAILAEITDAAVRTHDDHQTIRRFECLARPLGPIQIRARYSAHLPDLRPAYQEKLATWNGSPGDLPLPF